MSEWVKTNPNSKFLSMVRRISGVSNADIQNAFDSGLGFGMRVAGQKPATTAANAVMALGSAAKIGGSTGTFLAGLMGSFVKKGPTALRGAMRLLTRAAKNDPDYLRELAANRVVNSSWEDMSGLSKDSSVSGALEMLGEYRGSDVIRKLAGVHSSVSKAWFSNAWGPDAAFRLMLWSDEYYRLRDSGMDSKRAGYFAKKQTDVWIDMVDDVGTPMIIGTRLPIIGKILTQFKSSGLKSSQYIADVIVRGSTPDRLELATGMALTYSMFALAFGANPLGKIMSMPVPMLGEVMRGETPPVVDFLSDLANGELNSAFARQFEDTSDDESIARVMGARFPRSTGNPLMDIQSSVIKSTFDPKDQERAAERFASKPVYEEIHDTTRLKRKLRAKNRRIEELEGGL
jgi:hypothetical protein